MGGSIRNYDLQLWKLYPRDGEAVNRDGLISSFPFLAGKVLPNLAFHIYPFVSKYEGGGSLQFKENGLIAIGRIHF